MLPYMTKQTYFIHPSLADQTVVPAAVPPGHTITIIYDAFHKFIHPSLADQTVVPGLLLPAAVPPGHTITSEHMVHS
jgi:hypothetical protein